MLILYIKIAIQELRRFAVRSEGQEAMRYLDKMESAMTNEKEFVFYINYTKRMQHKNTQYWYCQNNA